MRLEKWEVALQSFTRAVQLVGAVLRTRGYSSSLQCICCGVVWTLCCFPWTSRIVGLQDNNEVKAWGNMGAIYLRLQNYDRAYPALEQVSQCLGSPLSLRPLASSLPFFSFPFPLLFLLTPQPSWILS